MVNMCCFTYAKSMRLLLFISNFVYYRSVELDEWTPEQLKLMSLSGNANAATFFRNHGVRDLHIKTEQKYNSGAARQYRAQLKKMLASESTMLPDYGDTDTPMSPSSSETDLESILQGFDEGRPAQPPLNKTGQFSLLSLT
jgi:uncharacterized alpha/beta hydrolase family protein